MIAIKMTIRLNAVGLVPLPGHTREDYEKEATPEKVQQVRAEVIAEWTTAMQGLGFELSEGAFVDVELVDV